ncbi:MAG TPA: hypothetical protein VNZ86_19555 [Bacteroidia bacterium]|jgi:hypothetical protein|nr:hypothetical protein [Bacteroidia bacterium]
MSLLKKTSLSLCLISLLGMVACRVGLHAPVAEEVPLAQQRWKDADLNSLQAGQKLYISHCRSCHWLKKPLQYSEDSWLDCLPEMCHKAHLNKDEQILIRRFMLTRRTFLLEHKKKK